MLHLKLYETAGTAASDSSDNGGAGNVVGTGVSGSDLNGDDQANAVDFANFASNWLRSDCSEANQWCDGSDLNGDESVDVSDLAEFAADWLQ